MSKPKLALNTCGYLKSFTKRSYCPDGILKPGFVYWPPIVGTNVTPPGTFASVTLPNVKPLFVNIAPGQTKGIRLVNTPTPPLKICPVSYTHLTLPTSNQVEISVVAVT